MFPAEIYTTKAQVSWVATGRKTTWRTAREIEKMQMLLVEKPQNTFEEPTA